MRLGELDDRLGRGDRRGRRRGDRRQARRPFPAGRVADRLGHPDQHERQRGDRQPAPTSCSAATLGSQEPGPSQRPRQPRPVLERQLPDGDAHRGGRGARPRAAARRSSILRAALAAKAAEFADIVKIGRTHLQDATPMTARPGVLRLRPRRSSSASRACRRASPRLYELAQGGTAVGTGLNAHAGFAARVRGRGRRAHRLPLRHGRQQVRGAGGA